MGTTNGVGTMYYGWRHSTDRSATATLWFVFFWLPILPLQRHRLHVLTNLREVKHLTPFQALSAFLGAAEAVEQTRYHILAKERVAISEILGTYAWTYVLAVVLIALRRARGFNGGLFE